MILRIIIIFSIIRTQGCIDSSSLRVLSSGLGSLPLNIYSNVITDLRQCGCRQPYEVDDGSFGFSSLVNQTICGARGEYPRVRFPIDVGGNQAIEGDLAVTSIAVLLSQMLSILTPPQTCTTAMCVEQFPGPVGPECQRLSNVPIQVCAAIPGWQSTGLYIPSGECVTLKVDRNSSKMSL